MYLILSLYYVCNNMTAVRFVPTIKPNFSLPSQPFWPTGSGCARGFLGSLDAAWMMRGWGLGKKPLDLIAERESIFRLLPQTTPENLSKNHADYTIDPDTRYPNMNKNLVRAHAVTHLYDHGQGPIAMQNGPEPMDTSKIRSNRIQNGGGWMDYHSELT